MHRHYIVSFNGAALAFLLAHNSVGLGAPESNVIPGEPWNLMVEIGLNKQGRRAKNCPSNVLSDLENEFRDWIQQELELMLGDDSFDVPNVAANEYDDGKRATVQVAVRGIPRRNHKHNAASIERPLRWVAQRVVDEWRNDVRSTRMDASCMGDATTRTSLVVYDVPYIPQSWKTTPIILGFQPMNNVTEAGEEFSTVIGVY